MGRHEIFQVIQSHMRNIIRGTTGKEILEQNSMRDFGADSLQIVEVVSRSMKQLRIKIPRGKLKDAQNLADLVNLFEQAVQFAQQPA